MLRIHTHRIGLNLYTVFLIEYESISIFPKCETVIKHSILFGRLLNFCRSIDWDIIKSLLKASRPNNNNL